MWNQQFSTDTSESLGVICWELSLDLVSYSLAQRHYQEGSKITEYCKGVGEGVMKHPTTVGDLPFLLWIFAQKFRKKLRGAGDVAPQQSTEFLNSWAAAAVNIKKGTNLQNFAA